MAELSYVEHLNIPIKYRGSILHSYEYNATVNKINEIIDNLAVSYEFNKNFPIFDTVDDIFASTGAGHPVVIHNEGEGKLYPITSSAYVLVDTDKNLDDELQRLNSQITSGINNVYDRITQTEQLIDDYKALSYAYTETVVSSFDENFTTKLENLRSYVDTLNSYLTGIVDELAAQHTIDIENIISYIPSYVAGHGIDIDENNVISVKPEDLVEEGPNASIYINSHGQLVVNNEVVLTGAESRFKFIDENGNWVGDMNNVKNYIDTSVENAVSHLDEKIADNASDIANLRSDMNTEITNMYTYVTKFTEYDTYGKEYGLSEEFIRTQE